MLKKKKTNKVLTRYSTPHVLTSDLLLPIHLCVTYYFLQLCSMRTFRRKTLIATRQRTCQLVCTRQLYHKCCNWPHNDDVIAHQCATSTCISQVTLALLGTEGSYARTHAQNIILGILHGWLLKERAVF